MQRQSCSETGNLALHRPEYRYLSIIRYYYSWCRLLCDPSSQLVPPLFFRDNPINAVTTKFIRTSTNKIRCPIFSLAWTPDGRRLMTGASSGEFTLWNGLTFNFETILQVSPRPNAGAKAKSRVLGSVRISSSTFLLGPYAIVQFSLDGNS